MTTSCQEPFYIAGGDFADVRGVMRFVNDFDLKPVRRFYTMRHPNPDLIRAWQGHRLETKCFFVLNGSFRINWVRVDHWEQPAHDAAVMGRTLTETESGILVVPPGHANGIKAMETGSALLVFSDLTLEESKNDIYRFEPDYWVFE